MTALSSSHETNYVPADINPPTPTQLSISPTTVDASLAPASITIELSVKDDVSGVSQCQVYFDPPPGKVGNQLSTSLTVPNQLVQGNSTLAVLRSKLVVRQSAPFGLWGLTRIYCTDVAGRTADLYSRELTALGFIPSSLFINQTGLGDEASPDIAFVELKTLSVETTATSAVITVLITFKDDVRFFFSFFFFALCLTSAGIVAFWCEPVHCMVRRSSRNS